MRWIIGLMAALWAGMATASPLETSFPSIDGGTIALSDYRGQPADGGHAACQGAAGASVF